MKTSNEEQVCPHCENSNRTEPYNIPQPDEDWYTALAFYRGVKCGKCRKLFLDPYLLTYDEDSEDEV